MDVDRVRATLTVDTVVEEMLLDIDRLKRLGWRPKYNSIETVGLTVKELLE